MVLVPRILRGHRYLYAASGTRDTLPRNQLAAKTTGDSFGRRSRKGSGTF